MFGKAKAWLKAARRFVARSMLYDARGDPGSTASAYSTSSATAGDGRS